MVFKLVVQNRDGLGRMLNKTLNRLLAIEQAGHEAAVQYMYSGKYGDVNSLFNHYYPAEKASVEYFSNIDLSKIKDTTPGEVWRKYFSISKPVSDSIDEVKKLLPNKYSAVHIRRGDAYDRNPFVPSKLIIEKIRKTTDSVLYLATDSKIVSDSCSQMPNVVIAPSFFRYDENNLQMKGTHFMSFELNIMEKVAIEALTDIYILIGANELFGGKSNMIELASKVENKTYKDVISLLFANRRQYREYLRMQFEIFSDKSRKIHIEKLIENCSSIREAMSLLKSNL